MYAQPSLRVDHRRTTIAAAIVTIGMLVGLLIWSGVTQISGAVVAQGVVDVTGQAKTVQHLSGGTVTEILVENGSFVQQGQALLKLDDTLLRANLSIYKARRSEAQALHDRLIAEQEGTAKIAFRSEGPDGVAHQTTQTQIFDARRALWQGRRAQLEQSLAQFESQKMGILAQINAKELQLGLLTEELSSLEQLAVSGLARTPQLLSVQRLRADLLGQIAAHRSDLAQVQNAGPAAELELLQAERQQDAATAVELHSLQQTLFELEEQLSATQTQLDHATIRAPSAGYVHELQVTTVGAVIAPGAVALEIIPQDQGHTFRLSVPPNSIDQIFMGQNVTLRLPVLNADTTPELRGLVTHISATSVQDVATGQAFFRVSVDLAEGPQSPSPDLALLPGMPVEAFLKTGDRSVLSYLTKPVQDQFSHAFRER